METAIRYADSRDIPELVRLRLSYFAEEFGVLPQETVQAVSEALPKYFAEHLGKDCIAVAAAQPDGTLVSCALLVIIEKPANPSFPNGRTGNVLGVYTEPEMRRCGLATGIMKQVQKAAESLQLDTVTLSASHMGQPIYERIGFRVKESHFTEMEWNP